MRARPLVQGFSVRTGRVGPSSGLGQRNRSLDVATIAVGLFLLMAGIGCREKEKAPPPPPPEVEVVEVVQQNVPTFVEWVAQLNGPINADITPKVQGYVLTQNYQNGFFVKKGQLLFTIDPRPFVAALDQAKAQVAVAQANLGESENNVARDTPLVEQNAIPKKQLDTDQSTLAANQAQLDAAKAQMVQARIES